MAKVKAKNPIIVKIMIIIIVMIVIIAILLLSYIVLNDSNKNKNIYDLGEKSNLTNYEDEIITNYSDYLSLLEKYNLQKKLIGSDFSKNNYIVSYQEYDSCSESKYKTVKDVKIKEDNIVVTFLVHNTCGWCKKHITLHLIKVGKNVTDKPIEYKYEYAKKNNCGTISKTN